MRQLIGSGDIQPEELEELRRLLGEGKSS